MCVLKGDWIWGSGILTRFHRCYTGCRWLKVQSRTKQLWSHVYLEPEVSGLWFLLVNTGGHPGHVLFWHFINVLPSVNGLCTLCFCMSNFLSVVREPAWHHFYLPPCLHFSVNERINSPFFLCCWSLLHRRKWKKLGLSSRQQWQILHHSECW